MIAKITTGKNFTGVIRYNEEKVEKGEAKFLTQANMPVYRSYKAAEYLRRNGQQSRVKNQVFHVSLSFSKADKDYLNDQKMIMIAKEYMDKMGMKNHPFLIYRHHDTEHPHMHIVASKINPDTGKKVVEKNDRYKSKRITSSLEKSHDLTRTKELGNGLSNSQSKDLERAIQKALQAAPTSYAQLNNRLEKQGSNYRVKGSRSGVIYYKVDEKGKQNSASWKGALFKEKGLDKGGLNAVFEKNKQLIGEVRAVLDDILKDKKTTKIPLAAFEKALLEKGIGTKYAIGKKGIYGLSFTYQEREIRASQVSRNYTWNKLKEQLDYPPNMRLREALKADIINGNNIHIKAKTNGGAQQYQFNSANSIIQEALNNMDEQDAIKIAQQHNSSIEHKGMNSSSMNNISTNLAATFAMTEQDKYLKEEEERTLTKGLSKGRKR